MLMVDWLTVEVPDPIGVPLNDGFMCRIRPDNSLDWSTPCRLLVRGSHGAALTFRALGESGDGESRTGLTISGNPAKFLQGHNLFGPDCAASLLRRSIDAVREQLWPDHYHDTDAIPVEAGEVSRIDLTGSWLFDRAEDVKPFLRALEERVWCPYRGRGVMDSGGSTLYYGRTAKGKRAKDWALKLYWKGPEITAHPLPRAAYEIDGLLEWANRLCRVELTLRRQELKRLGLTKVGDWTPAKVREIWEAYVAKLNFGDAELIDRGVEDLALNPDMKPRHLTAIAAWKAGHDLRSFYRSTSTLYRVRNEVMELTGIDLFVEMPKSNVVPLRRVVTASPALLPHWADHLTAALQRAA